MLGSILFVSEYQGNHEPFIAFYPHKKDMTNSYSLIIDA